MVITRVARSIDAEMTGRCRPRRGALKRRGLRRLVQSRLTRGGATEACARAGARAMQQNVPRREAAVGHADASGGSPRYPTD